MDNFANLPSPPLISSITLSQSPFLQQKIETPEIIPRCSTMANLPHKMPGKALFVYSMCLLSLIPITKADPTFRSIDCNSTEPDQAFCPSVTKDVCSDCINYASRDAVVRCPGSNLVSIVYDECTYSNVSPPTIEGADPTFSYISCPNTNLTTTATYAQNSPYKTNLDSLLSVLVSNSNNAANGFYNYTVGTSPPDIVYGLFLCRGDLNVDACRDCITYASTDVVKQCPGAKQVMIWYDECILRYSNTYIFAVQETREWIILVNPQNVTNATRFSEALGQVMNDIAARASSGDSRNKFATGEANFSSFQLVYGLAQCTPDLSNSDCDSCLRNSISKFPYQYRGARIYFPNCFLRGELYPFYDPSVGAAPPPPSPVLPPSPPTTNSTKSPGYGGLSSQVIIAIVVPIGVAIILFIAGFCCLSRRAKKKLKKYNFIKEDNGWDDISAVQSLQYDLGTIQAATNNFSEDNRIGEGGFGSVYKGSLPDGQQVAVKRLSQTLGQGVQEFKNEVLLVAKLQHRNLVRLLGFCLEGEEKLLIYEFVPNKSLDYFLFDQQEQILDWSRRYKIIGGIARGMLYLHEDSQLKIIHRDLKTSNILLDGDMNAKISDFGMAQILRVDQTQGNASEIVGTFGYMSPEYAMHGQFSTESDVFSFGVLILELITGMKNNSFCQSDIAPDLLSYAWKFWNDGAPLHLMDSTQKGPYSKDEVIKCIHIALLCVQDNPSARPSMATVVAMLDGYFATLSLPQQPAFHGWSRTGLELHKSRSKPLEWSMNEVSISELEPR